MRGMAWADKRLEAAYDALDDAMAETHPELGEHDALCRAMGAIEDADIALERLAKLYRHSDNKGVIKMAAADLLNMIK